MTYRQTLDYLFQQLPMFHRIGAAAYKADLSNTIEMCRLLGHPEQKFKSIHIAGTNGKGSTSHFIASVLQQAGYRTGLFTSPHLKDFRERIKINGRMISKKDVTAFVASNCDIFEDIQPSFFEWTFALASWYFEKEKIDYAVIETGMGGRLDSTNLVKPVLTIITNIGLDHTQFLGNTLSEIATEKAGIIKQGVPVVIGESQAETWQVFEKQAQHHQSFIVYADKEVLSGETHFTKQNPALLRVEFGSLKTKQKYKIISPLAGKYQLKNLKTVLTALEILQDTGLKIQSNHIISGIRNVIRNTGLMGRWQTIAAKPLTIADIGHNPDGIREVLEQIALTPHRKLHFVIGVVNDKDVQTMLSQLPVDASYYFCKADIPRGLPASDLAKTAKEFSLQGEVYPTVKEALIAARETASSDDLVIVGGSAFVVAEVV